MQLYHKRSLLLSLMYCFFTSVSVAQCDSTAYKQAITFYQKQQFDSAITSCTQQIRICPFAQVYVERAFCYYNLKKKTEAFKDFHSAAAITNNKTESLFRTGNILFNIKQYNDAFTFYHEVSEIIPSRSDAWYRMARCKWLERLDILKANHVEDFSKDPVLMSGLKNEIMRYYDKAINLDSVANYQKYISRPEIEAINDMQSNYTFYSDRAMFRLNFGDFAGGLKDIKMANKIHPVIENYRTAAYLAKKVGEKDNACTYMQKWATMFSPSENIDPVKKREEADKFCKELK